jgi:hypothetical protein
MFSYSHICVGVDMGKDLLEVIQQTLDSWKHIQPMNYDKIPFKCKQCHEYGNFAKKIPNNLVIEQGAKEKWDQC